MTEYRTYSVKHVQNLEHNLKVEMEARDRFHEAIIELDVIIMSLNRRIEKLEAVHEAAKKWASQEDYDGFQLLDALAALEEDDD